MRKNREQRKKKKKNGTQEKLISHEMVTNGIHVSYLEETKLKQRVPLAVLFLPHFLGSGVAQSKDSVPCCLLQCSQYLGCWNEVSLWRV